MYCTVLLFSGPFRLLLTLSYEGTWDRRREKEEGNKSDASPLLPATHYCVCISVEWLTTLNKCQGKRLFLIPPPSLSVSLCSSPSREDDWTLFSHTMQCAATWVRAKSSRDSFFAMQKWGQCHRRRRRFVLGAGGGAQSVSLLEQRPLSMGLFFPPSSPPTSSPHTISTCKTVCEQKCKQSSLKLKLKKSPPLSDPWQKLKHT